jgi:type III pantothenate kinase
MIAVDVGNTKIAVGQYRGIERTATWTLGTAETRSAETLRRFEGEFLVLASVVPRVTEIFLSLVPKNDLHLVSHQSPLSFQMGIGKPESVGADRIANLEGGIRKYGAPLIILSAGTATVLSLIDPDRRFVGGVIAPGLRISAEALVSRTALLPPIDLVPPVTPIGTNTDEEMRIGVLTGHARMIDGLVETIREKIHAPLVATGGSAPLLGPLLRTAVTIDTDLTLDGLRCIFENLAQGGSHA